MTIDNHKIKEDQENKTCSNDHCDNIASHEYCKSRYCDECIHEHIYDDYQPL